MSAVLEVEEAAFEVREAPASQAAQPIDHDVELFKPWAQEAMGLIALEALSHGAAHQNHSGG